MGAEAVTLLLEIIAASGAVPRHRLCSPPISLRSSTGPGRSGPGPARTGRGAAGA